MIIKFIPFIPHGTNINFFGHRFYALLVSVIILGGSAFLLATKGLNFGVDFTGGTVVEVRVPTAPNLSTLRSELNALDIGEVSLQEIGDDNSLMIRFGQQDGGPDAEKNAQEKIFTLLNTTFEGGTVDYRRTEFVGPQVGKELKIAGLMAVLVAMGGIFAYIWLRFEWQYGIGAMLALTHDVVGILGLFALTQMSFDISTLAAILLVAAYSINETIIIFDRVRETLRKYRKMPMPEVINFSINSTLARTMMTSGSTILAIFALWLFGGDVIRSFVSALFIGIIIGAHSSYFVSANTLYYLNLRKSMDEKWVKDPQIS